MSTRPVDMDGLIEAAGRSFGNAQKEIGLPEGMSTGMLISDAEIDLKVGFRMEGSKLAIEPISLAASTKAGVIPEALSTIKVRYVAARSEIPADALPSRTREDVEGSVADRKDVLDLSKVLGDLKVTAHYVPELQLWATKVEDERGRIIRTVNIQDRA